jgi:hypothetical protein
MRPSTILPQGFSIIHFQHRKRKKNLNVLLFLEINILSFLKKKTFKKNFGIETRQPEIHCFFCLLKIELNLKVFDNTCKNVFKTNIYFFHFCRSAETTFKFYDLLKRDLTTKTSRILLSQMVSDFIFFFNT